MSQSKSGNQRSSPLAPIRSWLTPTDALERHRLAARLLGETPSVVDVGGTPGTLSAFLPGSRVTSVNITADADVVIAPGPGPLPLADKAFDASVSLDTLEHIPRADREEFASEMFRIARSEVVLACPLGSPIRAEHESANDAWFFELTGEHHPWIHEHIEHGPPTESELRSLFDFPGSSVEMFFNGDIRETTKQFRLSEASLRRRRSVDMARWAAHRVRSRPRLELVRESNPWTNRVFVVVKRDT